MNRRAFLGRTGMAAAALCAGRGASAGGGRPDIVVILADDLTPDGIHALGNPEVKTPNLDRLIARGTTFTQAHIQGSWTGAVCVASRTMLMTGLPVWRAQRATKALAEAGRTWPQLMRSAGYATSCTGKWHVPAFKPDAVFDRAVRETPGMPKDKKEWYGRPVEGQPDPFRPWDDTQGGFWEGGRHWSEVQADDGIDLLTSGARGDKPHCLYLAFNAPHDPRQAPKEYLDLYPPGSVATPPAFVAVNPDAEAMQSGPKLRDEALAPTPRTPFAIQTHRREYYAIITHLDAQIGRVLDAIERGGRADNTWIFFAADNGLAIGRHGLMGKQNMYEHSMRVPLVVAGPGVPKGERRDAPVYMQDLMATALDLAGAPAPEGMAFRSLRPLLADAKAAHRPHLYSAYITGQRMVTDGTHKLVLYPAVPRALLFDLKADPLETKDLAGDPASRPVMKKFFAAFLGLQKETGDALDVAAKFPDLG